MIKKPFCSKRAAENVNVRCDVVNEEGYNCLNCKSAKLTDIWADLKCEHKNHILNETVSGLVCKDFKKR